MNKVFKVIWNHATQTWTAVSELGHAKGKTKSKKIVKLTALAGAVIGSLAVSQSAMAAADLTTNDAVNIAANNVPNPTAGREAIAVGQNANASHQHSIAIGRNAASNWTNTISIGKDTVSSQDHAIAMGTSANAKGVQSVGVGSYTKAEANLTIAVGPYAQANKEAAIAMGSNATAAESNSVAVGQTATAANNNAIAIGTKTKSAGDNAIGIGAYAESTAARATAIGVLSQANGEGSFAGGASAQATGTNSVAIGGATDGTLGNKAGTAAKATGAQAIALGTQSNASGENSIAEGNGANASAVNATAIGKDAKASDNNAVALGSGSVTKGAIAYQSDTFLGKKYIFAGGSPSSVVSIGSAGNERQLVNVAAGRINGQSTDAINGSQLYAVADAVSNHHWVVGGNTTAQNTGAPQVSDHSEVKNKDIVEFQNGNGTKATIEHTAADQSSGTPAKTVVKYHANIVNGDNTEVVYNADGSVKINAKVAGGTDTTAAVTTNTPNALTVTNTTANNVTTYNVNAKTGSISTTTSGAATYDKNGDSATGGDYGSRLTNVSTVTDIVNNVSWHLNSSPVSGTNGKITEGSDTQAADVKASNTVNINAGKNIEIKRNGTTIEISSTAGEKGDTGATGAKGDTGAAGAKGDTGAAGAKGEKGDTGEAGSSVEAEVVNNNDGTHTLTVTNLGDGSITTTIIKDGKNGKDGATGAAGKDGKNATATVVNNNNGTHTVTIVDGNGQTTSTVVKDGKNAEASVTNNGNGTHTLTVVDGNGNTTTTIVKDGATGAKGEKGDTGAAGAKGDTGEKGDTGSSVTAEVVNNNDGTHTLTVTNESDGSITTTIIKDGKNGKDGATGATGADGKNAEADVKDNGDGTHTVTIKDGNGNTTTAIIKDGATGAKGDTGAAGKNAEADVKDNGDGTHTVTIKDGNGNTTTTIVKDGATGAKGDTGDSITGEVVDNGDGTHTITITNLGDGSVTTTIVKDGKNGKDGATGATGADGKNAEADVKDNGDGTHTVTIKDGNGNTTTTIVKDGKNGKDGVMTWDIKSTGNKAEGSADTAKTIKHTNTVDMAAGKNLTVNQTNNSDGAKVEFALNSTVTNLDKVVVNGKDGVDGKDGVTITAPVEAKDGKDGSDGKVGISGKDGKDAVSISGKDGVGQIGLTGPKGKDGKDGASINITTDNGKQTLVNREVGADGKPGKTTQRIIYVPTDKDGNPLKDENGNTIKREVATMDDGLIFGGNTGEAHKAALGTQVNVKGATTNTDWNKFDAGKNIMTQVNGNTITVGLAKDLEVDNVDVNNNVTAKGTISAPTFKAGDTTIKNGVVSNLTHHIDNPTTVVDDKVLNITDEKKKEAATVRDVLNSGWNLQANGKPVDAVTHGNNVNFASDKGTVTVKANSDGKTSVVNLDVNVDNDTITVNNKGQLVANGATNFNVATKDGGNKVAKKGGSSTAKITAGKTITYTAGKNIAIEQNGGEILVSTTNDVNHNSVTTNDLTVNKGGNIDMGGNQIHNVKAGTKDTDAVNVSQLKQSIGDVHKRINKVGKEARGGIAGANAAAGLPQVYIPGKSMVAASAGTFKGESAVAVGYSRSSDNGKVIFKLQGNANTQGDVGGSVGVGYQW